MRVRIASICALAAGLGLPPLAAFAAGIATFNESALSRGFALPEVGEPDVKAEGQAGWSFSLDLTNEFDEETSDEDHDEALRLDGETQRWTARYRRGFGSGWEASVDVPLLHAGSGGLDSAIENWHDTFGLPDGGRDDAPRNRFDYRYVRDGVTRLAVTHGDTGLGDIRLGAGRALTDTLVARAQLKLPTGDEDILGGGNTGGAAWVDWALPMPSGSGIEGFLSGGVSAQSKADAMPHSMQNTVIPFGAVGLGAQVFSSFRILTQFYLHAPLFDDTEIDALKRPGLQFVLGGRWCFTEGRCLELAFQEDPIVASSPDFSLHFAFLAW